MIKISDGFNVEHGYFDAFDKLKIFYRNWNPVKKNNEKAIFIGVHGGEVHSGNLKYVAEYFSDKGYPFYALDRRGHGNCDVKSRMYVKDYNLYIKDIETFIKFAKEKEKAEKVYLVAHSNGGGQSIIVATRFPELIDKMILSAPSLKIYGTRLEVVLMKIMAQSIGTILPKFTIKSTIKPKEIIRDKTALEERFNDELINRKFSARWVREIFRFQNDAKKNIHKLKVPTLFIVGTGDRLVDSYFTMEKFETIEQKDKMKLNVYEGYWHELYNEKQENRMRIFQDIEEFIKL